MRRPAPPSSKRRRPRRRLAPPQPGCARPLARPLSTLRPRARSLARSLAPRGQVRTSLQDPERGRRPRAHAAHACQRRAAVARALSRAPPAAAEPAAGRAAHAPPPWSASRSNRFGRCGSDAQTRSLASKTRYDPGQKGGRMRNSTGCRRVPPPATGALPPAHPHPAFHGSGGKGASGEGMTSLAPARPAAKGATSRRAMARAGEAGRGTQAGRRGAAPPRRAP